MSSKKFRVARAGQTTDGREITAAQIIEMAETYSPATYNARINVEHIRSLYPGGTFGAYGDVLALSTETDNGQTYLVAEIDPTPELVALAKARQKVHFSIEMDPAFAGTQKAYLVGLAVTDSPASLGTGYMQFCAAHPEDNPYKDRKQNPRNLFSSAELSMSWPKEEHSIRNTLKSFFQKQDQHDDKINRTADAVAGLPDSLCALQRGQETIASALDGIVARLGNIEASQSSMEKTQIAQQQAIDSFAQHLDTTPAQFSKRPVATGGDPDQTKTDC